MFTRKETSARISLCTPKEWAGFFTGGDSVGGSVFLSLRPGVTQSHSGLQVVIKGLWRRTDTSKTHCFFYSAQDILSPGVLRGSQDLAFNFEKLYFQYPSYVGALGEISYSVLLEGSSGNKSAPLWEGGSVPTAKMNIDVRMFEDIISEEEKQVKLEVGIEDCLHIDFRLSRTTFHLQDVLEGVVTFHLAKLRIRYMEIDLLRQETLTAADSPNQVDCQVITRYEVMEGTPARHTQVPVQLFLACDNIGPTISPTAFGFAVRYFVNLVLVDTDERRYFKKHEIKLVRLRDGQGSFQLIRETNKSRAIHETVEEATV